MNRERLAKEAFDEVEAQLRAGDLRTARRALAAARELATAAELERAAVLGERLALCERLEGPSIAYDDALTRGDWLAARDQAERAARLPAGEESAVWRARAAELGARVNTDWRIGEAELDGAAGRGELADCAGLIATTFPAPPPLLTDDGSSLVLVSTFGRWVFVREVAVDPLRLRRICWLRSQVQLDHPTIQVEGNSIHLIGCSGEVLQLSLRPFGIARRYSLRPFMLPDRSVAESCVIAPGRFVWAQLKELEEGGIAVIDRDEWRVARRLHRFDGFEAVPGSEPSRMLATAFDEVPRAGLHDESGKAVEWNAPPELEVKSLAAHPGGEGFPRARRDRGIGGGRRRPVCPRRALARQGALGAARRRRQPSRGAGLVRGFPRRAAGVAAHRRGGRAVVAHRVPPSLERPRDRVAHRRFAGDGARPGFRQPQGDRRHPFGHGDRRRRPARFASRHPGDPGAPPRNGPRHRSLHLLRVRREDREEGRARRGALEAPQGGTTGALGRGAPQGAPQGSGRARRARGRPADRS